MKRLLHLGYILLFALCNGCLEKLSSTYLENISLGELAQGSDKQPSRFVFECPKSEVLHLVIRLKSSDLSNNELEEIRKTWENNYSVSVQIHDSNDVLVFSETFNKERRNVSTGGNWLKPDISFILLKNIEKSLIPGSNYKAAISVVGEGLQGYSLDLFLNRAYVKNESK